ncbi:hypothetical protein ACIGXM_29270 [Kitasatospora sp. NPDC052896]|uniref:hypothetical protein n=1 Tax=Kitasatospora sp. NPDC052896 TaxID=3364061 RepID=UPI0037C7591E
MVHGIDRGRLSTAAKRTIDLEGWSSSGVPLLRDPRALVTELHQLHLPQPGTGVIAVLDLDHRVVASASVAPRPQAVDGWQYRNDLLALLRRVIPHDLRLVVPRRTAVLLCCRDGADGWTEPDGPRMWALRDATALHGLRCGAYVTLTPSGWQVLGEGRHGRTPHAGSWAKRPVRTVSELPPRIAAGQPPGLARSGPAWPSRPVRGQLPASGAAPYRHVAR